MRRLLVVLGLLLAPAASWAGTASFGCGFTGTSAGVAGTATGSSPTKKIITANDRWCYRFVAGDTTTFGNIQIVASSAKITFDPDIFDTVTSTARVIPHYCPQGAPVDTANPLRSCPGMGGANGNVSLDGTEGSDPGQNAAKWVGPSYLVFEISAACAAGDTCQVVVEGAGETQ